MAAAYAWHPGKGVDRPRWVRSVPMLPDEIISSWLVRAALAQGCDPMVLTGEIWPKWRIWTRDVDRFLDENPLTRLVAPSGIPLSFFRETTLKKFAGQISGKILPAKAVWPWILALGARNTKRRSGLQYCPACLRADSIPYFRLQWRFAWHAGCAQHHCILLDRCPHCRAPLEPHRLRAEDSLVAVCASCKGDLRNLDELTTCSDDALAFQNAGDGAVRDGKNLFMAQRTETDAWFAGSAFLISLLRRANRSNTEALHVFLGRIGVVIPELPLDPGTGVELLSASERQLLLDALWKLIKTDLADVSMHLEASGITRQGFVSKGEQMPDLFSEIYAQLPDNAKSPRKPVIRDLSQPRSRHEVMRMWRRLQRKLEMQQR
ncbi:TniQ family protein [Acidithiobacillus thiooxidans]|uniref:TniQ family protein n=1 Tax=Acidithiobacillus thiooxidans TaxID=930 RepID=UPI002856BD20|nr:TniQ family protein [Acidithiobacillus thiooxidans]MDR7927032.1 TniQ family protein [Acidithiobacillus thiooxidans]